MSNFIYIYYIFVYNEMKIQNYISDFIVIRCIYLFVKDIFIISLMKV